MMEFLQILRTSGAIIMLALLIFSSQQLKRRLKRFF